MIKFCCSIWFTSLLVIYFVFLGCFIRSVSEVLTGKAKNRTFLLITLYLFGYWYRIIFADHSKIFELSISWYKYCFINKTIHKEMCMHVLEVKIECILNIYIFPKCFNYLGRELNLRLLRIANTFADAEGHKKLIY